MPSVFKNLFAVLAGILLGSIVNMAILSVGPFVVPLPEGIDMSDWEKFSENLMRLKPLNFLPPWLAHALGTLMGSMVTAKLATSNKMLFALGISSFFLLGGILMVSMVGGPLWFTITDLVGAYLPMGYLGGILGGAHKPKSP